MSHKVKPGSTLYYCCRHLAPDDRDIIVAIHALYDELYAILLKCNETMTGRIRIQWWRDALSDAKRGKVEAHPVLSQLAPHLGRIETQHLFSIMTAIDAYFITHEFSDSDAVREFRLSTTGNRDRAIASVLKLKLSGDDPCASEASAITDFLRTIATHQQSGFLPLTDTEKAALFDAQQRGEMLSKIQENALIKISKIMINNNYFKSTNQINRALLLKMKKQGFPQLTPAIDLSPIHQWWLSRL